VTDEAMKIMTLAMECNLDDFTDEMQAAFEPVFVAACAYLVFEFNEWTPAAIEEDDEDLDPDALSKLTAILTEFGKSEEVQGAPV
jgi:hypothetical protein